MDLLKDLKVSLLNFNFFMIYIIHKMLVLLKINLSYLKDRVFKCFSKENNIFFLSNFFHNI